MKNGRASKTFPIPPEGALGKLDLSVILVSHGHGEDIRKCLEALPGGLDGLSYEIILIDNLREPDLIDQIGGPRPGLRIIANDECFGFGANVNKAASEASGRVLLVLNPDTAYVSGQMAEAITFLEQDPSHGIVAARLVNADGSDQRNFRGFPSIAVTLLRAMGANDWANPPDFYRRAMRQDLNPEAPTKVDWVYGSFMLVRREDFARVGGFDDSFFMYYEDVDLCLRLRRADLSTWVFPDLTFFHDHKRDSSGFLPSKHQIHHVKSLFRYAWKAGAMVTPPTFDAPALPSAPSDHNSLVVDGGETRKDPGTAAQLMFLVAILAGIGLAALLSIGLVSLFAEPPVPVGAMLQASGVYALVVILAQIMLGEFGSNGIGDTGRRLIGIIESAILGCFPFFAGMAVYGANMPPAFPAFASLFLPLALVLTALATVYFTRRLPSPGARIGLVLDAPPTPGLVIPQLPVGLQSIALRFQGDKMTFGDLADDIAEAIRGEKIDHIYILSSRENDAEVMRLVRNLTMFDVPIWQALCDAETRHEVLRLRSPLRSRVREALKRGLDISICVLALIILLPPLCIIALMIFIEDPGPVFFGQNRVGRNQVPFRMLKLRSMYLAQSDEKGDQLTTQNDSRITRIGSFIRRTSIDELPQLINVLRGEMSIVGPRPLPVGFHFKGQPFDEVIPYWNWRTRVAPGITGLSQLNGLRGTPDNFEESVRMMENRVGFDNLYIDRWTIWLDLKIIFLTALSGAFVSKAY